MRNSLHEFGLGWMAFCAVILALVVSLALDLRDDGYAPPSRLPVSGAYSERSLQTLSPASVKYSGSAEVIE